MSLEDVEFIKAACGPGDYLIIRTKLSQESLRDFSFQELATRLCPRTTGVGARGILALSEPSRSSQVPVALQLASGRYSPDFLSADALFCAARFLFDSGVFGIKPIPIRMRGHSFSIESVDSQNFRLELWTATNDGQPIGIDRVPQRQVWGKDGAALPLELHQKILALYRPSIDVQSLKKIVRSMKQRLFGRTIVAYSVLQNDLILAAAVSSEVSDFSSTAALIALAAYLDGFSSEETLVTLNNHPFFVQISMPGPRLWVTTPVRFLFSGMYSPESTV